jgi:hypothetical protein
MITASTIKHGDQPVQVAAFLRNIARCRAVLWAVLPVNAAIQVLWAVLAWKTASDGEDPIVLVWRRGVDIVIAVFAVSSASIGVTLLMSMKADICSSRSLLCWLSWPHFQNPKVPTTIALPA